MKIDYLKIDEIITRIKEGSYYTIACSMYEETFWYKDGSYYKSMENGVNEPTPRKTTEDVVKHAITKALIAPELYEGFFEN